MSNAMNAPQDFYNLNRNNQNVIQSNLDQSWPKEDLPPLLYHKGLKLMPLLRPDLQPVQPEQKAARHPMNRVKIARLANPVPTEPLNAKCVAKEGSVTKMAPPAKSAKWVPFKIKTHYQVYIAKLAPLGSTTVPKD